MNGGEVMYSSMETPIIRSQPLWSPYSSLLHKHFYRLISSTITAEYFKTHFHYQVQYITPTIISIPPAATRHSSMVSAVRWISEQACGGDGGTDMEVIIDLGEKKTISSAGGGFLQDEKLDMDAEINGNSGFVEWKKYKTVAVVDNTIAADNYDSKRNTGPCCHLPSGGSAICAYHCL